jgi:hypothetical protein
LVACSSNNFFVRFVSFVFNALGTASSEEHFADNASFPTSAANVPFERRRIGMTPRP